MSASFDRMMARIATNVDTIEIQAPEAITFLRMAGVDLSLNRPNDKYDDLGRNVSAQKRRQDAEPWVVVSYKRAKSDQEDEENEE